MSDLDLGKIFSIAANWDHITHPLELTEKEKRGENPSSWDRFRGVALLILMVPLIVPSCLFLYWANKKVEQLDLEKTPDAVNGRSAERAKVADGVAQKSLSSAKSSSTKEENSLNSSEKDVSTSLRSESINSVNKSLEREGTELKGSVCVVRALGFVKNPQPDSLLRALTQEDGTPIDLNFLDTLVLCKIFNPSEELINLDVVSDMKHRPWDQIELPHTFISGKKEGDLIRFKYNNNLIELTVNQVNFRILERKRIESSKGERTFASLNSKKINTSGSDFNEILDGLKMNLLAFKFVLNQEKTAYTPTLLDVTQIEGSSYFDRLNYPIVNGNVNSDGRNVVFNIEVPNFRGEVLNVEIFMVGSRLTIIEKNNHIKAIFYGDLSKCQFMGSSLILEKGLIKISLPETMALEGTSDGDE